MFAKIVVRNKKTGEIMSTGGIDGLYIYLYIDIDGSVEIDEIGQIIDISTTFAKDTKEIVLDKNDYEIITIELPKRKRGADMDNKKINKAIKGLKGLEKIIVPTLLNLDYEGLGKEDAEEFKEHINLAVKALEKQIAKNPTNLYKLYTHGSICGECPNCGHSGIQKHHDYCWWCGQKLNWNNCEEER